jgi:hypothetical protein
LVGRNERSEQKKRLRTYFVDEESGLAWEDRARRACSLVWSLLQMPFLLSKKMVVLQRGAPKMVELEILDLARSLRDAYYGKVVDIHSRSTSSNIHLMSSVGW